MGAEQLLKDIHYINGKFTDSEWVKEQNGNVLSYTALKLAAMKAYLVDEKQSAHQAMMDADIEMDTAKAVAYLKAKEEHNATAAQDLKNMDPEYIEAKKVFASKKVYFDKIKSVVTDTHDMIESIRSRIIDLQSARKDENIR